MKQRIQEIINYKTGGRQNKFAQLMGWSPQYTGRLLKEGSVGLQPLLTILEKLPEIDARWLLLGQGSMLMDWMQRRTFASIQALIELEELIPYMSAKELQEYEDAIFTNRIPSFSQEAIRSWQEKKNAKDTIVSQAIKEATE